MAEKDKGMGFDLLKIVVIAVIIAIIIRKMVFSPIIVDGPSMQPTLYDRDQMIVNKLTYHFSDPKRFDILIFHANDQKDFIKRVIGLPGEHIAFKDNMLYVDGEIVAQPFLEEIDEDHEMSPIITYDFTLEQLPGNYEKIPEGHLLVLGDNRTNSTDSRALGLISYEEVIGKTNFIYWPFERIQYFK